MEKYYKCPNCGDLITESAILTEIEIMGGGDMCMCQFQNERRMIKYVEISYEEYKDLRVLRAI